jgi:hypothetical protein
MSAPFQRRITRGLGHAGGGPHPYLVSVKFTGFSTQSQATRKGISGPYPSAHGYNLLEVVTTASTPCRPRAWGLRPPLTKRAYENKASLRVCARTNGSI